MLETPRCRAREPRGVLAPATQGRLGIESFLVGEAESRGLSSERKMSDIHQLADDIRGFCRWLYDQREVHHSLHSQMTSSLVWSEPIVDKALQWGFVKDDSPALNLTERGLALVAGFPVCPRFDE